MSILVKKKWNLDTGYSFRKISIWGQIFRKFRSLSAFSEIFSTLVKKKNENFDACQNCQNCQKKSNLNFGQNFRKSQFSSKVSKNLDFRQYCRKIKILVKISRMWILVKIFGKSQFWSKFLKISISVKILGILDLSSNNLDFGQNFQIIEFCQNLS